MIIKLLAGLFDSGTTVWTFVIAIFTILIWSTARHQLKKLNTTSAADFMTRFKNDLFKETNIKIFELIDNEKLKIVESKSSEKNSEDEVLEAELDYCIGHFEDMGLFEQRGVINIEMVYELFGYYIETSWENPGVNKYIIKLRDKSKGSEDLYDKFEYIYKKSKSFGRAKRAGENLTIWKLKWWICKSHA